MVVDARRGRTAAPVGTPAGLAYTAAMQLTRHPAGPPGPACRFSADARRAADGALVLDYRLEGALGDIALPAPGDVRRADGLWQHTCFEAFLLSAPGPGYREFNFAPSGAWAAWDFSACRQGMRPAAVDAPPEARWTRGADVLALSVRLAGGWSPDPARELRIGLTAVLARPSGTMTPGTLSQDPLTYWALHHPRSTPDFHDPDGFRLVLAPLATAGA